MFSINRTNKNDKSVALEVSFSMFYYSTVKKKQILMHAVIVDVSIINQHHYVNAFHHLHVTVRRLSVLHINNNILFIAAITPLPKEHR